MGIDKVQDEDQLIFMSPVNDLKIKINLDNQIRILTLSYTYHEAIFYLFKLNTPSPSLQYSDNNCDKCNMYCGVIQESIKIKSWSMVVQIKVDDDERSFMM